ncbi:PIG-L family deacetylase [Candidatus Woesearchaeota archaeon]|nr:PIG-L family deacetylase [Candidatus Woesearchaeota archaeon]
MANIIVLAAHPDDDMIGCGGSLAKREPTDHATIVYFTSGEAGSMTISPDMLKGIREEEARKAAVVLGIDDLVFLRHPDGHLQNSGYGDEAAQQLTRLLRACRPDVLYTHSAYDAHADHRAVAEITRQAVFGASGNHFGSAGANPWRVPTVLAYEVWTPHQNPQLIVDITDVMDKKLDALRQHASQVEQTRYDEAVHGLARYRGVISGVGRYAEAFEVIRVSGV